MYSTVIKIIIMLFFLKFPITSLICSEQNSGRYLELKNGLKVFLQEKNDFPLINATIAVNVGSKDEGTAASGIVHLLEHLILVGSSQSLSKEEQRKCIRSNGINFNAHTNRDFMTFVISAPSERYDITLDFLKKKVFKAVLIQDELENEKKIVCEEIFQIKDNPMKIGTTMILQNLFHDHIYSIPVFGKTEYVKKATIAQLNHFYIKYFNPDNASLAVVGNFEINSMEKYIRDLFDFETRSNSPQQKFQTFKKLNKNVNKTLKIDTTQAHLFFGFPAPSIRQQFY